MMRYWSEQNVFNFDDVAAEDRAKLAARVYDCLGQKLAEIIRRAVRERAIAALLRGRGDRHRLPVRRSRPIPDGALCVRRRAGRSDPRAARTFRRAHRCQGRPAQHRRRRLVLDRRASARRARSETYPEPAEADLRQHFPEARHPRREPRQGRRGRARGAGAPSRTDVVALHPDLAIWQVGTNAVLRRDDLAADGEWMREGVDLLKRAGIDVVLMDLQYAPRVLDRSSYPAMEDLIADSGERRACRAVPPLRADALLAERSSARGAGDGRRRRSAYDRCRLRLPRNRLGGRA
jgi:hypothetical protein